MASSTITCCLLLFINLQLFSSHPIGMTSSDLDVLKDLLERLEAPLDVDQAEQRQESSEGPGSRPGLDEDAVRELLSLKNLKSFGSDSSKRTSSCFGARMERIGSMSSLGCNTAGKYNPKRD